MKNCTQCNGYLSIRWKGNVCYDCQQFEENPEEVDHGTDIRCPNCGHQMNVYDSEQFELMSEGEHQATCGECGHDFQVMTEVSYTFYSPARLPEDDTNESK